MTLDQAEPHVLQTLLTWIQISVAAGLLYVGLPAARYRSKLLDAIAELLKNEAPLMDNDHQKRSAYSESLRSPTFQEKHNLVATWIGELLESKTR